MAFSKTLKVRDVQGAMQVRILDLNFASVTEGHVKTGLSRVHAAIFVNNTSEAQGLVQINSNAAGNGAERGSVRVSGVTSSDVGQLIVYGI